MPIRWDALLVHHTARELSSALRDGRLRAVRFDRAARDAVLLFREHTLLWGLRPGRGYLRLHGPIEPARGDYRLRARLRSVEAPLDERLLTFELSPARGAPAGLVVELLGNQWNAFVTEGEARVIRHVLWRREGEPRGAVGQPYRPPRALGRRGIDGDVSEAEWVEALGSVPPEERAGALVRHFAWTSPLNAEALVGAPDDLAVGHARWRALADRDASSEPVLLRLEAGLHPYPFPLAGTQCRHADSLLSAFEECAAGTLEDGDAPVATALGPELVARLERAVERAARRTGRLEDQLHGLEDPAALRAIGDLILARYGEIPGGASEVRLTDFDGTEIEVPLDPADPPHENASRYYRRAARSERARVRLPELIDEATAEHARLLALLGRARAGAAGVEEVAEVLGRATGRQPPGALEAEASLPYRSFTSSGGLEIRVGRGARHNDDLTFRHSSPADLWLHARHSAGAHVILRWTGPGRPPARDLHEAATLAALHSKARTAGSVPVDWTLRKYVRKPRKAPPGTVVPDRVETLFVEPDPALLETLQRSR